MITIQALSGWRKNLLILGLASLALSGCIDDESNPPQSVAEIVSPGDPDDNGGPGGFPFYPPTLLFEHADFEFCCGGYDTYGAHGFVATGDMLKLDGGEWAESFSGRVGERVFASFGNGYPEPGAGSTEWVGWESTGTLTTPAFTIPARYINFLAGGGTNPHDHERATAIVLMIGSDVVRQATGNGSESSLSPVTWDVGEYIGQQAYIRIIDLHPHDDSDASLPFVLVDQIEASSEPATAPGGGNGEAELVFTDTPATEGFGLFSVGFTEAHIAGFEFCCGGFNTYQNHGFGATGGVVKLDGGEWASDIGGSVGERIFMSYGRSHDGSFLEPDSDFTGRLLTPEFAVSTNFINFLVGGGTNAYDQPNATAVVMRINGQVVRQAVGNDSDSLEWRTWDVSALRGQRAVIEIIDEHAAQEADSSLPFILADEFRAADKAAVAPEQDSLVTNVVIAPPASRLKMGDPNPYYEDGTYHLFYLHDAGRHPWYLADTTDLVNYSQPVEVLPAGPVGSQEEWIGSGSVIKGEDGTYHLFYTGHNQNHSPVEAVMQAISEDGDLENWTLLPGQTFSGGGSSGYSTHDFRDPWVFWNEAEQEYWMLLTTRHSGEAVIGLYTSPDLYTWTAQPPLYSEVSPLNLEVPDMLTIGSDNYLLYSDQRDESRQVRHLAYNAGTNAWEYPQYDALDGHAFYAARTAGPGATTQYPSTLLFEHADFEFCCAGYGTYEAHGFAATGDFLKFDGGEWAEHIEGRVGERVFASFGNGYPDPGAGSTEWVGWEATGTLTTPTFEIPARYINFLAGGGTNAYDNERATAVVLVVDGEIVRHAVGNGQEDSLSPVSWDVGEYIGQQAYIRIIDQHNDDGGDGSLPFILVDRIEASSESATHPDAESHYEKMLFGWVPHKNGYANSGLLRWGGDLVTHQVGRAADGSLAVSLPNLIRQTIATPAAIAPVWQQGDVQISGATVTLGAGGAFVSEAAEGITRISAEFSAYAEGSTLGIQFRNPVTQAQAFVAIDTQGETVSFFFAGDQDNPQAPTVAAPLAGLGLIKVDVLLDSHLDYGVVYVNDYRALTFRFYELDSYGVGFYAEAGAVINDLARFE